ncbi:MAG: putative DNA binding domain-containing protein [Methylotenera sp.]|nr:putative DNA binding domain-containing protein [Oligoflexia bacterium]
MTEGELKEIVSALRDIGTDHADVEAKACKVGFPKRLWETLSAFANTANGGIIILGLDEEDNFSICGVKEPRKVLQDFASLCDQMEPPIRAQIHPYKLEGKTVIVAEIPEVERDYKPCYYKGSGQTNGAFIRVSDGDRRLTSYEIQLFMASRGQPRNDEEPVEEAAINDLDKALVKQLVAIVKRKSRNLASSTDLKVLRAIHVVTDYKKRTVPTIAGILALGKDPQQFFPALSLHFVVYPEKQVGVPGPQGERFLDNRKFEGSIASILDQALAALSQHMIRKTLVRGADREDVWQYPETALREVIVNALVHRDLSSAARGTPVQIHMFPDRLTVRNPGGLFGPVTIESLGVSGTSAARNATLMRLLEEAPAPGGAAPICENRGSGIGAMISALTRAGMEPPAFDDKIASFTVTFPNASLLNDETLSWLEQIRIKNLTDTQRMGLALLHHGNALDNSKYRQITGLDSRVATRELGELVKYKLIEQIGTRRWATYRLTSGSSQRRDRRSEIILTLKRRGELSRSDIARELNFTDMVTRHWLSKLRKEGQIELLGPARSPSARYRIKKK